MEEAGPWQNENPDGSAIRVPPSALRSPHEPPERRRPRPQLPLHDELILRMHLPDAARPERHRRCPVRGKNIRVAKPVGRAAWHAGLGPEFPEPVERPDHFYRVSLCFSVPVLVLASVRRVGCVESISGVPMCVRESGVGDSIRNRRPVLDYNRSVGLRSVVTCELVQ